MASVFVVRGITGEYGDERVWSVRAFTNRDSAAKFVRRINEVYKKFHVDNFKPDKHRYGYQKSKEDRKELERIMFKLDPDFEEDYTGTSWFEEEVVLNDG